MIGLPLKSIVQYLCPPAHSRAVVFVVISSVVSLGIFPPAVAKKTSSVSPISQIIASCMNGRSIKEYLSYICLGQKFVYGRISGGALKCAALVRGINILIELMEKRIYNRAIIFTGERQMIVAKCRQYGRGQS